MTIKHAVRLRSFPSEKEYRGEYPFLRTRVLFTRKKDGEIESVVLKTKAFCTNELEEKFHKFCDEQKEQLPYNCVTGVEIAQLCLS